MNSQVRLEQRNRAVIAQIYGDDDESESAPNPYKLMDAAQVHARPRMEWLVDGVLPTFGCAAIYGASGSGKSFLQIDLVAAIAEGRAWFGHRVGVARRVVVLVLEGEAGFRNRIEAWEVANKRTFPVGVKFVFQPFHLTEIGDVNKLAEAIHADGGTDVLVIDTLNRAAPHADENSSRDMGRILENGAALQRMFGGLLLLAHHSGKDAQKGMRGHSSLHAALDAAIEVSRGTGGNRKWSIAKAKDGSDGSVHPFVLEIVKLGDGDGGPMTSCVVRATCDSITASRAKTPKGGNQKAVFDALAPLLHSSPHSNKPGVPVGRPCLSLDEAVAGTKNCLANLPPKRRTERTRLAIDGLVAAGILNRHGEWIWMA